MAQINLLPWRDQRRQERKREFLLLLVAAIVLGGLAVLLIGLLFDLLLQNQKNRNAWLVQNIASLNRQVETIHSMQRKKTRLLERMQVIQQLQGNRPVIVRILDQLVRTVPDGVFYTELRTAGQTLYLSGIAQSNQRVSSLMRRLEASDWFAEPQLEDLRAEPSLGAQTTAFNMAVQLRLPAAGAED